MLAVHIHSPPSFSTPPSEFSVCAGVVIHFSRVLHIVWIVFGLPNLERSLGNGSPHFLARSMVIVFADEGDKSQIPNLFPRSSAVKCKVPSKEVRKTRRCGTVRSKLKHLIEDANLKSTASRHMLWRGRDRCVHIDAIHARLGRLVRHKDVGPRERDKNETDKQLYNFFPFQYKLRKEHDAYP